MKKIKKLIGGVLLLSFFLLLQFGNTNAAEAKTCRGVSSSYNVSVYYACQSDVRTGALWISSSSDYYDLSTGANYNVSTGTVDLYLRGAIICHNSCAGYGSDATYIKLIRGNSMIGGMQYYNYSNYGAFSDVPGSMYRPEFNTYSEIWSNAYKIKFNLDKMVELEGNNYRTENGRRYYSINIQAYRCMATHYPSEGDYYCGSDINPMVLNVSIPEPKSFQAEAKVDDVTTNYVNDTKANSKTVSCTDISNGCNVTFTFNMKRVAGSGSTTYTIQKAQANAGPYSNVETGQTFNPQNNNVGGRVKFYNERIKAGQTICYRIIFYPFGSYSPDTTKTLTVCAYGVGNFGTSLNVRTKKDTTDYDNKWLYVKPTDKIYVRGEYTPAAQYPASLKPAAVTIAGNSAKNTDTSRTVQARFNTLIGNSNLYWANAFTVQLLNPNNNKTLVTQNGIGTVGETTTYRKEFSHDITNDDVGNSYDAIAKTNVNNDTKTTPKSANVTYVKGTGLTVTVDGSSRETNPVKVLVPYNFNNSTIINDDSTVVYAGEEYNIKYNVIVDKKMNARVGGEYATIVRGAKRKVEMQVSGGEWKPYGNLVEGIILNDTSSNFDSKSESFTGNGVIPDVQAGTQVCFRSGVYPKNSGADENLSPAGNEEWAYSKAKCYTVAKRPSFQVWGGNIYSSGGITASRAAKIDLADKKDEENPPFVFGSWGELGVIAGGEVKGLASGAGYANLSHPGAPSTDFCTVSTLSFANDACQYHTGGINVSLGNDKKLVLDKLKEFTNPESGNSELQQHGDFEWYEDGKLSNGIHFVSNYDGDLWVDRNIIYTGTYTSLESMPKVVIYGKNVKIQCAVTRIDALIIAEETVDTCSDIDDVNAQERSTQLTINGAVIANKVDLKRTYGAGVGYASGIPAEIINFDPSLYLWGGEAAPIDSNDTLDVIYLRELAPRF